MDKTVMAGMFNKNSTGIGFPSIYNIGGGYANEEEKSLMVSSLNDVIARNGEELEIISVKTLKK